MPRMFDVDGSGLLFAQTPPEVAKILVECDLPEDMPPTPADELEVGYLVAVARVACDGEKAARPGEVIALHVGRIASLDNQRDLLKVTEESPPGGRAPTVMVPLELHHWAVVPDGHVHPSAVAVVPLVFALNQ